MHTQTMPVDRIITADEIAPATLKLLLNEEDDTFRPAGIFTHNDLVHIKRYIHYGMALPGKQKMLLSLSDTEIQSCPVLSLIIFSIYLSIFISML